MRAARLRTGVDLPVAAAELRISFQYLQAIEEGRFNDLPGHAYARGFLRSYAEYLDIDPDIVVDAFKAEVSDARPATRLDFPSPMDRGRLPTGRILAASIILAGLVYAGWYLVTNEGRRTATVVTPVPERLAALAVDESVTKQREAANAGDSLAAAAATVETENEIETETEIETEEPRAIAPVAVFVDVPPARPPLVRTQDDVVAAVGGAYVPHIYGAGTDNPRVVVIARFESWVQVRSGGGELLLTRILRPGDRYLVPDRGDLLMMTGNAGALQIYVDGTPIPAIGPIGAVRRDISLAPARLLSPADSQ